MIHGGDLFGDRVNTAARLQAFAEPGGLCLSAEAHAHIRKLLPACLRGRRSAADQEHRRAGQGIFVQGSVQRADVAASVSRTSPRSPFYRSRAYTANDASQLSAGTRRFGSDRDVGGRHVLTGADVSSIQRRVAESLDSDISGPSQTSSEIQECYAICGSADYLLVVSSAR